MLAGDVFRDGGVRRRLALFKAIYYLTSLAMLPAQFSHWLDRRRQTLIAFEGGTTRQDDA
jgi:hypothetical protein